MNHKKSLVILCTGMLVAFAACSKKETTLSESVVTPNPMMNPAMDPGAVPSLPGQHQAGINGPLDNKAGLPSGRIDALAQNLMSPSSRETVKKKSHRRGLKRHVKKAKHGKRKHGKKHRHARHGHGHRKHI